MATRTVVPISELPQLMPGRYLLEGRLFGLDKLTVILGDSLPGHGTSLHRHDYEELFIVHAGQGTYTIGDDTVVAGPGEVVIIPSGVSHRFRNLSHETLSHTAVHATGTLEMVVIED